MKNQIQSPKVLIGGFIAGMIINIIDTPNGALIGGPALNEFLTAHHIVPNPFVPAYFLPMHIVFGVMLVWLYAAMIPTYGAGRKNALYATLAILIPTRLFSFGFVVIGLMPMWLYLVFSASVIIGFWVGGWVGTWYYRRKIA